MSDYPCIRDEAEYFAYARRLTARKNQISAMEMVEELKPLLAFDLAGNLLEQRAFPTPQLCAESFVTFLQVNL